MIIVSHLNKLKAKKSHKTSQEKFVKHKQKLKQFLFISNIKRNNTKLSFNESL